MAKIKNLGNGKPHEIVCILVEREGYILLLKRKNPPISFACPSGHVDEGENFEVALTRELKEETGIISTSVKHLLSEEFSLYPCRYDGQLKHLVKVSIALANSWEINFDRSEFSEYVWVKKKDLDKYTLDPLWKEIFIKIGYIDE